jgi:hypothetical protein
MTGRRQALDVTCPQIVLSANACRRPGLQEWKSLCRAAGTSWFGSRAGATEKYQGGNMLNHFRSFNIIFLKLQSGFDASALPELFIF